MEYMMNSDKKEKENKAKKKTWRDMRLRDVENTGTTWMSGYSENGVLIYSHTPDNEGKN